jgi:hypothetical protein
MFGCAQRSWLPWATLLVATTGCRVDGGSTAPAPKKQEKVASPEAAIVESTDVLEYHDSGVSVVWRGGELQCSKRAFMRPQPVAAWSARPSRAAWETFWRRVDGLAVWTWGSRKETRWKPVGGGPGTTDGRRWSLRLSSGGREVSLSGYNELPDHFAELVEALLQLAGRTAF